MSSQAIYSLLILASPIIIMGVALIIKGEW